MPAQIHDPIESPLAFAEARREWQAYTSEMDLVVRVELTGEAEASAYVEGWNACARRYGAAQDIVAVLRDPDGVYYHTPAMDAVQARHAVTPQLATVESEEVTA